VGVGHSAMFAALMARPLLVYVASYNNNSKAVSVDVKGSVAAATLWEGASVTFLEHGTAHKSVRVATSCENTLQV
jgi:hypothetical protein